MWSDTLKTQEEAKVNKEEEEDESNISNDIIPLFKPVSNHSHYLLCLLVFQQAITGAEVENFLILSVLSWNWVIALTSCILVT